MDDNEAAQHIVGRWLETKGYATVTANNGEEALRYLHAGGAACLIVLDLNMPVMDGRTLCRELQADPALAGIPVIAYSTEEARAVAGIAAWVPKTSDPEDLLAMIELHCLRK